MVHNNVTVGYAQVVSCDVYVRDELRCHHFYVQVVSGDTTVVYVQMVSDDIIVVLCTSSEWCYSPSSVSRSRSETCEARSIL